MKVSVIISTYNSPEWLQNVLWGYERQSYKDFEIIIADDGSQPDTGLLIQSLQAETPLDIKHVWHEDKGYRRQTILNRAILKASTDYIIFTDGDCIPRKDFVETHMKYAEQGRFLSGGYCKISLPLSKAISRKSIVDETCFKVRWLVARGAIGLSQRRKLSVRGAIASLFDWITTAKPTFNNCNSSGWKKDILAVNGYDERMQYGGADREIGARLENHGIRGKQIRHRAICLHLFHERGYAKKESIRKNLSIRRETRRKHIQRTPYGIQKLHQDASKNF